MQEEEPLGLDEKVDLFLPEHKLEDFQDPKPLKCPPMVGIPEDQVCPYLHCLACKHKLIHSAGSYLCFGCDAVYLLIDP